MLVDCTRNTERLEHGGGQERVDMENLELAVMDHPSNAKVLDAFANMRHSSGVSLQGLCHPEHPVGNPCWSPVSLLGVLLVLLVAGTRFSPTARASTLDFAEARHADDWLHHTVYGDPSFDSFEHSAANPIHRGASPFEWPVNGFLFPDPVSGHWYVFVGDYGKGYLTPPSRCLLYRSIDRGSTWTNLGVVLHGAPELFDHAGHTPDVSVVYADNRYHMIYDWGEPNFNAEGGLAYAWADRPEGPWHRAVQPITRNSTLPKLLDRYQRTYAATLLRRQHDWLILGMMDHAPNAWALFAMTASKPDGPYSERRLVRHVEGDYFHPPLLEFFPAFVHGGFVYAPATSVALNRDCNVIFRAPLERAHEPASWSIFQLGSVWHSEDREAEHYGIWGQTFSGMVDPQGVLRVMFPSRDAAGLGTINLAQRPWHDPLRRRGMVMSGHQGPSFTLLRRAYEDFTLTAALQLHGTLSLLFDYAAPLGPNTPSSDASLHPLMNTRHLAWELGPAEWKLEQWDSAGEPQVLAAGRLDDHQHRTLQAKRSSGRLTLAVNHQEVWSGQPPLAPGADSAGVLGLRLGADSHLLLERFRIQGKPKPAHLSFLWTEALLGAGEPPSDWTESKDQAFHYGSGAVSKLPTARAKWNIRGTDLKLWSPRGPNYGSLEVRLDGRPMATLDLHADQTVPSRPVWTASALAGGFHAVALVAKSGTFPLDCLEVAGTW